MDRADRAQLDRLSKHWRIIQAHDDRAAIDRLVKAGQVERRRQRRGFPGLVRITQPPEAQPWVGRGKPSPLTEQEAGVELAKVLGRSLARRHYEAEERLRREGRTMPSYTAIIEAASDGTFGVFFPDVPGCTSAGDTIEEATTNAAEALEFYLEDMDDWPAPSDPANIVVDSDVIEVARIQVKMSDIRSSDDG